MSTSITTNLLHQLNLNASLDSKITSVTLYPDCAHITRSFDVVLKAGTTNVKLSGGLPYSKVPPVIVRVERSPSVALRDVQIITEELSHTPKGHVEAISTEDLEEEKVLLQKSLSRCKPAPTLLEAAFKEKHPMKAMIQAADEAIHAYEERAKAWDKKIQDLERGIRDLERRIQEKRNPPQDTKDARGLELEGPRFSDHIIQFSLEADTGENVHEEVRLVYAQMQASWVPEYDIFATSINSEDEVKFAATHKAIITNETKEAWNDVSLTLEILSTQAKNFSSKPWVLTREDGRRGIANASHFISGKVSIPGGKHKVTISGFEPEVAFKRYCTPAHDLKVALKARITNGDDYSLRYGDAHIYCDGNYIQTTHICATGPGESFTIDLGFDPKISVAFPSPSAITAKAPGDRITSHEFFRRISVHNNRAKTVKSFTLIDQYPVTNERGISTRLRQPELERGEDMSIPVQEGTQEDCNIIATWDKIQMPPQTLEDLGRMGLINWICRIGGKQEINVEVRWNVTVWGPRGIRGL